MSDITRQAQKYHLSLAGEFYVAAELQRRGISAAVTYGNAKSADVVAFSPAGHAVVIEVKSTSGSRWVVGGAVPLSAPKPWVFVHIPANPSDPPGFYVIEQSQLRAIIDPGDIDYRRRYLAKHGEEYGDRRGVVKLSLQQAEPHKDAWDVIVRLLDGGARELLSPPTVATRQGHEP